MEVNERQRVERPLGEIVSDMVAHAEEIIRSEIRLARTELREEGEKAMWAGQMMACAGAFGLSALLFALLSGVFALSLAVPIWASALIVAGVAFVVALFSMAASRARWREIRKPDRTIGELKENYEWLKHPTRS